MTTVSFDPDAPSECGNCGWSGKHADLIDGIYCPNNATPDHPASARPQGDA